jgi:membrane-bound lytic murein transglycosylase MltF
MNQIALLACAWAMAEMALANPCAKLGKLIEKEGKAAFGLSAPIPALTGMIYQESTCNPQARSWDGGEGLGQLTGKANVAWIAKEAGLGKPDTFDARWNLRASFWLLNFATERVQAKDECHRFGAAFKAYNAGLGWTQKAQAKSAQPGTWFGVTEDINAGQSAENFRASREYPRRILMVHQPKFSGRMLCRGELWH